MVLRCCHPSSSILSSILYSPKVSDSLFRVFQSDREKEIGMVDEREREKTKWIADLLLIIQRRHHPDYHTTRFVYHLTISFPVRSLLFEIDKLMVDQFFFSLHPSSHIRCKCNRWFILSNLIINRLHHTFHG